MLENTSPEPAAQPRSDLEEDTAYLICPDCGLLRSCDCDAELQRSFDAHMACAAGDGR